MPLKLKKSAVEKLDRKQKQGFRHKILVVDDEEANLRALVDTLEQDYEVLTATDGQEALELIKSLEQPHEIHLIISDQRMPLMNGVEFLKQTIPLIPSTVRIILTGFTDSEDIISSINDGQIYRFLTKPTDPNELLVTAGLALETYDLKEALQDALKNLQLTKITNGVFWLQIPEANLYILCGCPADVVKHMKHKGLIAQTQKEGVAFETGPNAILLADSLIQKGEFSNLSEFPVLQMLYLQGMIIPNHPNNKGAKPLLLGVEQQVKAQMEYIYRGNYGLTSLEEIIEAGVSPEEAEALFRIKLKFAFGNIQKTEDLLDSRIANAEFVEIRNGVSFRRTGFNQYEFQYKGSTTAVDLNLGEQETYEAPYQLGSHQISREAFAVLHTGEGDGWDIHRPCMASILMYQGDIYLIDAGPSILQTLRALGIDISEVKGIFHTHAHDDHFAGLPILMRTDHRIKYYSTPLVRSSVSKKLAALMSMDEKLFYQYFEVHDLEFDTWNNVNGLEVQPIYSPHPVEANVFLFRVLGAEGSKTYAHWADLTSFDVLNSMCEEDSSKPGMSPEFCQDIKDKYLTAVDLKKVDIGGGMIHGQVKDYVTDQSKKIILAHTAKPLTPEQKEVGSEAFFGTMDILIPNHQNFLRKKATETLHTYFEGQSSVQLQSLLNNPMEVINPGTIILGKGEKPSVVYLILSGTVECILGESDLNISLSTGSFIGVVCCLKDIESTGTYRTLSHVQALAMSITVYRRFLETNGLLDQVISIQDNIEFLRMTWLFGEGLSSVIQNNIAQHMEIVELSLGPLPLKTRAGLYLLREGEIHIQDSQGQRIESLCAGDFFGEETVVENDSCPTSVHVTTSSKVYWIPIETLEGIPIVSWKLLEVFNRRSHV